MLKNKNFKLKISNRKILDIKKNRENYALYIDDNKKTIETLRKECDEYKRLYELTRKEFNKVQEQNEKERNTIIIINYYLMVNILMGKKSR